MEIQSDLQASIIPVNWCGCVSLLEHFPVIYCTMFKENGPLSEARLDTDVLILLAKKIMSNNSYEMLLGVSKFLICSQ